MKLPAKIFLGIMIGLPMVLVFPMFPGSAVWLAIYVLSIFAILKTFKSNGDKGTAIIYFGAAIAVIGKHFVPIFSEPHLGQIEDELILETFFQVMLMASSGIGGSFVASHFLVEKK
ncbi:TPA: hypothetical protein KDY47_003271 [Vibrio parahaemolyticus]|nr:hypothetical protein [Vibrio parahaemolyticus]